MTEEMNTSSGRKLLLHRQRLVWFTLLNVSTLLIGCYLAFTHGNGTFAVLLLMTPLIGTLSWLANWASGDPKVLARRYEPAVVAMLKNAASSKHSGWSWLNDGLLWGAALLVLLLLLING